MSPKKRLKHPYHHGDLRRALLEEAIEILKTEGEAALSLRELARRLGVSHAAPLHHFPDKTALLMQLSLDGFTKLADALTIARERPGDACERLEAVGHAYVHFALENPGHFRTMFRGLPAGATQSAELRAAKERAYQVLIDCAAVLVPHDRVDREPKIREIAFTAWSLVHGAAVLWLDRSTGVAAMTSSESFETLVAEAITNLRDGVRNV